jgi:hypothetical protein
VNRPGKSWLIAGALLSAAAAVLHLAVIAGGPDWYRSVGAGEEMARMAERGSPWPTVITLGIATLLAVWAAYALAGAGLIRRLPLIRTALVLITAIYMLRGLALLPLLLLKPNLMTPFDLWSSLIVLAYGIVHAVGTVRAWPALSRASA